MTHRVRNATIMLTALQVLYGADSSSCLSSCDVRHETALDQLEANPVCKDGPASAPVAPGQN